MDQARQLVEALGGDTTVPTTEPPSDAEKICNEHRPSEVGDLDVTFVSGSVAGFVTTQIRSNGGDPAPWDQLPADHMVVQCGYGRPAADSSSAPVLILGCYQYYVDADGRSTQISAPSSSCERN
jgi:hypothetical protein